MCITGWKFNVFFNGTGGDAGDGGDGSSSGVGGSGGTSSTDSGGGGGPSDGSPGSTAANAQGQAATVGAPAGYGMGTNAAANQGAAAAVGASPSVGFGFGTGGTNVGGMSDSVAMGPGQAAQAEGQAAMGPGFGQVGSSFGNAPGPSSNLGAASSMSIAPALSALAQAIFGSLPAPPGQIGSPFGFTTDPTFAHSPTVQNAIAQNTPDFGALFGGLTPGTNMGFPAQSPTLGPFGPQATPSPSVGVQSQYGQPVGTGLAANLVGNNLGGLAAAAALGQDTFGQDTAAQGQPAAQDQAQAAPAPAQNMNSLLAAIMSLVQPGPPLGAYASQGTSNPWGFG